jgi:hypothetical protein
VLLEYHALFSELHVPDAAHGDDDAPPRQATAPHEQLVRPMCVRVEAHVRDDSDPPPAAEDRVPATLREPVFELAAKRVGEGKRRRAHQPPSASLGTSANDDVAGGSPASLWLPSIRSTATSEILANSACCGCLEVRALAAVLAGVDRRGTFLMRLLSIGRAGCSHGCVLLQRPLHR